MDKINLNVKKVASLPLPKGSASRYRDTQVVGFGLKIEPSGNRSYYWSRRARGRIAWKSIGEVTAITLEEARQKASEYNAQLTKWKLDEKPGDDPFRSKRGVTLDEVLKAYAEKWIKVRSESKDPERAAGDVTWQAERYLGKWLPRRVADIRRSDVINLHDEIGKEYGRHTANRVVQMLKAAINRATTDFQLYDGPNPAAKVRLFREEKRARFLSANELYALRKALNSKKTTTDLRDFVLMALFSGARKSDVLSMSWKDVDLERATWHVPDPKGEPYTVALASGAVALLRERHAAQKRSKLGVRPFVFPSSGRSGHVVDLKGAWAGLLKRAKLTDLRQHDLRRTMAAMQAGMGSSLMIIGKSLGHEPGSSATSIYARLDLDPVRQSVEAATLAIQHAMTTKPPKQLEAPNRA